MMVTEEKAKTKRCPMTLGETWGTQSPRGPSNVNCIGSACMAWIDTVGDIYEPTDDPSHSMTFTVREGLLGFCGMAAPHFRGPR